MMFKNLNNQERQVKPGFPRPILAMECGQGALQGDGSTISKVSPLMLDICHWFVLKDQLAAKGSQMLSIYTP